MSITHTSNVPVGAQSEINGSGVVCGEYALSAETISTGGFAADIKTDQTLPEEPCSVLCYDKAGGAYSAKWIASTKKIKLYQLSDGSEVTGSTSITIVYEARYRSNGY